MRKALVAFLSVLKYTYETTSRQSSGFEHGWLFLWRLRRSPKLSPVKAGGRVGLGLLLAEGRTSRKYAHVCFKDYGLKGIQVSFENDSSRVHNMYFYNQQRDSPEFGVFCGEVDKGINWQSSVEDVKRAYGQPTAEFSGTYLGVISKRLMFEGIDFRFENEKMGLVSP